MYVPVRMCVVCRKRFAQSELIRIGIDENKGAVIDAKRRCAGRGAYICKNPGCIKKAAAKKPVSHALHTNSGDEIYKALEGYIDEGT